MSPSFLIIEMERIDCDIIADGFVDDGPIRLGMTFRDARPYLNHVNKQETSMAILSSPREIELQVINIFYFGNEMEELDVCGRLILRGNGVELLQKGDLLTT